MMRVRTAPRADHGSLEPGVVIVDVSGITRAVVGAAFAPDLRYERWLTGMKAELVKKIGKERANFEHLLSVMAESRYRQQLRVTLGENPIALRPLLAIESAVLVCPCQTAVLCHRRFLAKWLTEHGVVDMGEVTA